MNYALKLYDFEVHLYEEEKSVNTIKKYIRDVKLLCEFLKDAVLSKQQLLAFKEWMVENYAPKSVNSMIASANKFLEFIDQKALRLKPIKIQKEIFSNPETELTREEYQRLLDAAAHSENERLLLVIQTICQTGIRVSELQYITVNSLHNGREIVKCKGKQRVIMLPKKLRKCLKAYCKKEKIIDGIVFRTKSGKPIDRSNIWKMMKRLCHVAEVPEAKVFPHNLRHLFARTYYEIEKDISKLADILGHSNINTTRIYIMETGKHHEKQIDKLSLLLRHKIKTT